jgi:hypothetical protein
VEGVTGGKRSIDQKDAGPLNEPTSFGSSKL